MREILFRGKQNNGEWIEGSLINAFEYTCILQSEDKLHPTDYPYLDGNIGTFDGKATPVILETVGQFTGLTDKNDKKIFEGDILRIARKSDGTGRYYIPPLNYPVNVVVKWDMCAWMWETICDDKRYICFPEAWCHYECEIISNIHDNPELMKGE